jgi:hypothetical protein
MRNPRTLSIDIGGTGIKAIVPNLELGNFDRLYIGGGNAKKITGDLPPRVRVIPNVAGLLGGIKLWSGKENSYGVR